MKFAGQVAVVTGAAGGIGAAVCSRLHAEGAKVVAADLAFPAGAPGNDNEHLRVTADLRDPGAGRGIVEAAVENFGRADVVIVNAGLASDTELHSLDEPTWRDEIEINLQANFGLVQAALRQMRAQRAGVFVAMSSLNAHAYIGSPSYSVAKAGLESLMRSIAGRYGIDGIRANSLVLGTIATPAWQERMDRDPAILDNLQRMFPLNRVGNPEDVASLVAFVASADASWMTGASIVLDGGLQIVNTEFNDTVFGAGDRGTDG